MLIVPPLWGGARPRGDCAILARISCTGGEPLVVIHVVAPGGDRIAVPAGEIARAGTMPAPLMLVATVLTTLLLLLLLVRMKPAGRLVIVVVLPLLPEALRLPTDDGGVGARIGAVITVPRGPRLVTVVGPKPVYQKTMHFQSL